jgi:hypothetical protein
MSKNIIISTIFLILAMLPINTIANSRFSIYSTNEIITANGTRTLLGDGYRLVTEKDKVIFNGYDITDLINYIQYSTYSVPPLSILKAIDNKNPQVMRAVNEFNTQRNSKKVINALFFAAAQSNNFEKIKYYVNKGANVNYISPAGWGMYKSALGANLCDYSSISEYLQNHSAKVLREESSTLLSRCKKNEKELNFLLTQDIDWNQDCSREKGNLISYMLSEKQVASEILQIFLKAGSNISNEGFYGALEHNSSYNDIVSILNTNKALAYTPVIRKEEKFDFFSKTNSKYVKKEIYPLSYILDFDWSKYKSKECQRYQSCITFIKNRKLILEALLDAGAKPLNKKEEAKINKIRAMINDNI